MTEKTPSKQDFLKNPVEQIDITRHNTVALVEAMRQMAFSARDLARSAEILDRMVADPGCGIMLCLAGSLNSAGLKRIFVEMIRCNMVDAIVSTGANIVDMDFFEALGFRHYIADERLKGGLDDETLRSLQIDRIYDTLIDEEELRVCDDTVRLIAEMGAYLDRGGAKIADSIVLEAYRKRVPIFCPAFSDCSAGFGLLAHQAAKGDRPRVGIDSVKDFLELTQLKLKTAETGLFMIGGGVPKNFAQDVVVAADILGADVPMHKYAVQVTVADVRDGALSGSTLKEAHSWGKVESVYEQMVYSEATLAVPLIVGYAYHKGSWKDRQARNWSRLLETVPVK